MPPLPWINDRPLFACRIGDVFNAAQSGDKLVIVAIRLPGEQQEAFASLEFYEAGAIPGSGVLTHFAPNRLSGAIEQWVPEPEGPFVGSYQKNGDLTVYEDRSFQVNAQGTAVRMPGTCLGWSLSGTAPGGATYSLWFEIADKPR